MTGAAAGTDPAGADMSKQIATSHLTKQGPRAHLKLAEAYIRSHEHLKARAHLTKALRDGKGSNVSAEANKQLLMLRRRKWWHQRWGRKQLP